MISLLPFRSQYNNLSMDDYIFPSFGNQFRRPIAMLSNFYQDPFFDFQNEFLRRPKYQYVENEKEGIKNLKKQAKKAKRIQRKKQLSIAQKDEGKNQQQLLEQQQQIAVQQNKNIMKNFWLDWPDLEKQMQVPEKKKAYSKFNNESVSKKSYIDENGNRIVLTNIQTNNDGQINEKNIKQIFDKDNKCVQEEENSQKRRIDSKNKKDQNYKIHKKKSPQIEAQKNNEDNEKQENNSSNNKEQLLNQNDVEIEDEQSGDHVIIHGN